MNGENNAFANLFGAHSIIGGMIECAMCGQFDEEASIAIYHFRQICLCCQSELQDEADRIASEQLAEAMEADREELCDPRYRSRFGHKFGGGEADEYYAGFYSAPYVD